MDNNLQSNIFKIYSFKNYDSNEILEYLYLFIIFVLFFNFLLVVVLLYTQQVLTISNSVFESIFFIEFNSHFNIY